MYAAAGRGCGGAAAPRRRRRSRAGAARGLLGGRLAEAAARRGGGGHERVLRRGGGGHVDLEGRVVLGRVWKRPWKGSPRGKAGGGGRAGRRGAALLLRLGRRGCGSGWSSLGLPRWLAAAAARREARSESGARVWEREREGVKRASEEGTFRTFGERERMEERGLGVGLPFLMGWAVTVEP